MDYLLSLVDLHSNVLKCTICLELYTEERRPRTLKCGHTYCGVCLDQIIDYSSECPECRTYIDDNKSSTVSVSYIALEVLRYLSKDHTQLTQLDTSKNQLTGCWKHNGALKSFFCSSCCKFECRSCSVLDHPDHIGGCKIVPANEGIPILKQRIQENVSIAANAIIDLKDRKQRVVEILDEKIENEKRHVTWLEKKVEIKKGQIKQIVEQKEGIDDDINNLQPEMSCLLEKFQSIWGIQDAKVLEEVANACNVEIVKIKQRVTDIMLKLMKNQPLSMSMNARLYDAGTFTKPGQDSESQHRNNNGTGNAFNGNNTLNTEVEMEDREVNNSDDSENDTDGEESEVGEEFDGDEEDEEEEEQDANRNGNDDCCGDAENSNTVQEQSTSPIATSSRRASPRRRSQSASPTRTSEIVSSGTSQSSTAPSIFDNFQTPILSNVSFTFGQTTTTSPIFSFGAQAEINNSTNIPTTTNVDQGFNNLLATLGGRGTTVTSQASTESVTVSESNVQHNNETQQGNIENNNVVASNGTNNSTNVLPGTQDQEMQTSASEPETNVEQTVTSAVAVNTTSVAISSAGLSTSATTSSISTLPFTFVAPTSTVVLRTSIASAYSNPFFSAPNQQNTVPRTQSPFLFKFPSFSFTEPNFIRMSGPFGASSSTQNNGTSTINNFSFGASTTPAVHTTFGFGNPASLATNTATVSSLPTNTLASSQTQNTAQQGANATEDEENTSQNENQGSSNENNITTQNEVEGEVDPTPPTTSSNAVVNSDTPAVASSSSDSSTSQSNLISFIQTEIKESANSSPTNFRSQVITCMPEFSEKSLEELRIEYTSNQPRFGALGSVFKNVSKSTQHSFMPTLIFINSNSDKLRSHVITCMPEYSSISLEELRLQQQHLCDIEEEEEELPFCPDAVKPKNPKFLKFISGESCERPIIRVSRMRRNYQRIELRSTGAAGTSTSNETSAITEVPEVPTDGSSAEATVEASQPQIVEEANSNNNEDEAAAASTNDTTNDMQVEEPQIV